MNDDVKQHSEEVAPFRFGVIGDLVHLPRGAKGLYERLKEKADIDYRIPGSPRVRVGAGDDPSLAQGVSQGRPRRAPAQGARRPWPIARAAA